MALIDTIATDRLYRTFEVAQFEGVSTRTLFDYVKNGRFPPPDQPAHRRGAPDFWLGATIRRAREERRERKGRQGAEQEAPA